MKEADFVIVGARIIGLSIAHELAGRYPGARMVVLEKENEVTFHASGRNSGRAAWRILLTSISHQ